MGEENVVDDASSLEEHGEVVVDELDTSDEALNIAAEDTETLDDIEEDDSQEEVEEDEIEEPEDNATRTKLGRKVKAQELLLTDLNTKLDLLLANQVDSLQESNDEEVENEFDEDEPLTANSLKAMLPKLLKADSDVKNNKQATYEKGFLAEIVNQGINMDEEVHDGITQVLLEKYNKIVTGDPKIDAEMAFLKAERDYNVINAGGGKKVLRSKKAPVTDKPGGKGIVKKAVKMKKLDADAQGFVDKLGLSPEFVQRALGK